MFIGFVTPEFPSHTISRPISAIYQKAEVAEGGTLPYFGGTGTGGVLGAEFLERRLGYRWIAVVRGNIDPVDDNSTIYSKLMEEIQNGFGRTLSHLPAVFGVSRQTLYNWMNGELPKQQHREKLVQLAEAASAFTSSGFKPTAANLDRTVAKGKSFTELLREGSKGRETAERLIRIVQRGATERSKLDTLLGDRKVPRLEVSDMGRQSFSDEV